MNANQTSLRSIGKQTVRITKRSIILILVKFRKNLVVHTYKQVLEGAMTAPKAVSYRGSNKLLYLQCSNSSPWLKTPPVVYDLKNIQWWPMQGPAVPSKYRWASLCFEVSFLT